MPIDPSIPLSYRPPQFDTPSEVAARRMNLANIGQRNVLESQAIRENEMDYRTKIETQDRARRVQQILAESSDWETALPKIWAVDPYNYPKWQQAAVAHRTADRENRQKEYEFGQKKHDFEVKLEDDVYNAMQAVVNEPDEDKWDALYKVQLARFAAKPEYKEFVSGLPPEIGDKAQFRARATALANSRLSAKEQDALKTSATQRNETEARLLGVKAESRRQTLATVGQMAGASRNQAELDAALAGQPQDVRALFDATWTKDTPKRAGEVGLTLDQKAQGANQVATRSETAAHNLAQEDAATDRNAIARGKVGQRDQTSRLDRLQRKFDEFDADEQKWHAERERLGDILNAKNGETVVWRGRIEPMSDVLRASVQRDFEKATNETTRLYGLKERTLAEMGKGTSSPAPANAPQPAPGQQTFTEADVRKRAKAKGLDENAAVTAARSAGLIR